MSLRVSELVAAFIATAGFGMIYHVPIKYTIPGGFAGALGWMVFKLLGEGVPAVFLAALSIGLISEIGARVLKVPVLIIAVPGIIPLVPGVSAYWTMVALIQADYSDFLSRGTQTLFFAAAIAAGIALATVPWRFRLRGGGRGVRKIEAKGFTRLDSSK